MIPNLFYSIYSCHKTLACGFFISRTAIKLSRTKQIFYFLVLQAEFQHLRINTIVFYCICIPYDFKVLKPVYRSVKLLLNVRRKTCRHTLYIHFIRIKTFRFYKQLMSFPVSESLYFIFNRRAISRTYALYLTTEQR